MGTNSCSVSSPVGTEMLCSDWEALPICSGSIWEILSRCDHLQRFPWWLDGKESACNAGGAQETQVRSLGWEDPLE